MNSFLLALTAVLILVLGALFAVPLFVDWNDYRPAFEAQAAKLIGRDVRVGGDVHLVVLPAPELRFDDVKVAGEGGSFDQPLLEAKSMEAWLNIGALLRGAIEARKITLSDPVLRLALRDDGSFDLNDIGRVGMSLPFAPKEVMLDEISITGGRVELSRPGKAPLVAENIFGEASAGSLSGPYKFSGTFDFNGRGQDLRLATGVTGDDGTFHLKSALRDTDRGSVTLIDGDVTGFRQKPSFDGSLVYRITPSMPPGQAQPVAQQPLAPTATPAAPEVSATGEPLPAEDNVSALELKGDLNATADHAELPSFELTVHAQGRSQLLKGSLLVDYGAHPKTVGALSARWVDADALLAEIDGGKPKADAKDGPPVAVALSAMAAKALERAAAVGDGALTLSFEQVSVGGDLIGNLDFAATVKDGAISIERLKAELPGATHLDASGTLSKSERGPVFQGPIKLAGSKLGTLARWAAGGRDMSAQANAGAFSLEAKAALGGAGLKLDAASGELSGTKFSGALQYQGGAQRRIDVTLDSDRLDLRDVMGESAAWRSWLPQSDAAAPASARGGEPGLFASLRDDEVHVALRVGELVLPSVPAGSLEAKFALAKDTLDIERLDYAAIGAVTIGGKGHVDGISTAPAGTIDGTVTAKTPEGLRVAAGLLGLSEEFAKSKELAALAPLDLTLSLASSRDGDSTRASADIKGTSGGSQVALTVKAFGEPAKLAEAEFDIDGTIDGYRPQAVLGLVLPGLASQRLAATSGDRGKLTITAKGVPADKIAGRIELATASLQGAFDGGGALKDEGIALDGAVTLKSGSAAVALVLAGLEPSPSAADVPLDLRATLTKRAGRIQFAPIEGQIGGEPIEGTATFDLGAKTTKFKIDAEAGNVSLPALLGALIAWQHTPSTDEVLGSIAQNASQVWPARGFALAPMEQSEGEIALAARTISLGAPFRIEDATLQARVDQAGLTITDLDGALFGGSFAASGALSPKGAGAELKAHAELARGDLAELTQGLAGRVLAKGPFTLGFDVAGEGLSPPGLVAGLNGGGTLYLDRGTLQALSAEPLKRAAADAKRAAKLDKDQIAAKMQSLRDTLTTGTYAYAAAGLPFDIKNGTLKLLPSTLATKGAETTINGYVELASLRLDSEWSMKLSGPVNADLPPLHIVLAGAMNDAGSIVPAVDTAPLEDFLTVSRMQSDVERLETLDVSGRTQPAAEADQAAAPDAGDDDEVPAVSAEPEKLAADKAAIEKRADDRAAAKIAEAKRVAAAKAAAAKQAAEKAAAEKRAAEQAAAEKAAEEKRLAAEKAAAEKAAEAKRIAEEKAAAEKAAAEKLAAEKAAAEKAAEEKRLAAEQAAAEAKRIAEEKAAAAKAAAEQRAAELAAAKAAAKEAAEKAAEEKRLAAQAAAEKRAAEKAAAEKAAAEKAEAKRLADEKAAAEKAEAKRLADEKAAAEKEAAQQAAAAKAEADRIATAKVQAEKEAAAKRQADAEAAQAAAAQAAAQPAAAVPVPTPAPQLPQTPPVAASAEPAAAEPLPWSGDQAAPAPDATPTAVGPDGQAVDPAATAEDVLPAPPKPRAARKPKEAPDDWKKGISIFGGG